MPQNRLGERHLFATIENGKFGTNSTLDTTYQGQSWIEITSSDVSKRILLSPTRIYDPVTGRFFQNEPLMARRLLAQYLYARQNPCTFVDPSGLFDPPGGWTNPYGLGGGSTATLTGGGITGAGAAAGAGAASAPVAGTEAVLPVPTTLFGSLYTTAISVLAWLAYEPLNRRMPYVMPPTSMAGSHMRLYSPPSQPSSNPKCEQRCSYIYEETKPAPFTGDEYLECYYFCPDGTIVTRQRNKSQGCGLYVDE